MKCTPSRATRQPILGCRERPSLWANRGLGRLQSAPQVPPSAPAILIPARDLRTHQLRITRAAEYGRTLAPIVLSVCPVRACFARASVE